MTRLFLEIIGSAVVAMLFIHYVWFDERGRRR